MARPAISKIMAVTIHTYNIESADVDPAIDAGIFGSFSHQGQMW